MSEDLSILHAIDDYADRRGLWWKVTTIEGWVDLNDGPKYKVGIGSNGAQYGESDSLEEAGRIALEKAMDDWGEPSATPDTEEDNGE